VRRSTLTLRPVALFALFVVTVSAGAAPSAGNVPALAEAVRGYSGSSSTPSFEYALVDLNKDGVPDAIVLLTDREWCGSGGCTMLILRGTAGGFTSVSKASVSNQPIKVSSEHQNGWRALLVWVAGGGVRPGFALMRFNGTRYPFNPTFQPRATARQVEAAAALAFHKGPTS
jgi:hypothetical protein